MTITRNFEPFQYFNFETNFLRSKKNWSRYRFLAETTGMRNATFLYKTALSEVNVMTNGTGRTKRTYHKDRSFASNCFILKFCFSLRTSYKELIWSANYLKSIFILFVSTGVLFEGPFSLWVYLIYFSFVLFSVERKCQVVILNPWNVPWNWIAFYWNSFDMSSGLMRGGTGGLANEAYLSNPTVSSK